MPDTIIEIDELTKIYNGFKAVDGISLEIKRGEIFGLLGPNGAGKTTTILMLLGLTEPTSGSVKIMGHDSTREPLKVKKLVGYLPDQVGFYDNRSAVENLLYTARLNGIDEKKSEKLIENLLEKVGLSDVKDRKVRTYSRGMKQRLGLADVLVKEPEVIILDEPTIGIDPKGINDFLDLIKELNREKGITVLLSSHLLNQIQKICDRVGLFASGKICAVGNINELADQLIKGEKIVIELVAEGINGELADEIKSNPAVNEVIREGDKLLIKAREDIGTELAKTVVNKGLSLKALSTKEYGLDEIYQYYMEGGKADEQAS